MKADADNIKLRVQETLDELWRQKLIPFQLIAYNVATNGREYIARFNDSRIHSFQFYWQEGEDFKEVVRAAVLDRVKSMGGPPPSRNLTAKQSK